MKIIVETIHIPKPLGLAKLDKPDKFLLLFCLFVFIHCYLTNEVAHSSSGTTAFCRAVYVHSSSNFCRRSRHLASELLISNNLLSNYSTDKEQNVIK